MDKKTLFNIEHRIEELLLLFVILLNGFDFFGLLSADLDYAKKIISWSALGYLLYKASLTKIFFNVKHKFIDAILISSYFLMIMKNIVIFSKEKVEEFVFFSGLHHLITQNAQSFEMITFITGAVMIILISLYSAFKVEIQDPSLINIFYHGITLPEGKFHKTSKFLSIFFIFTAFFVVVFNMVMEWLALAVDAPIIIVGIVVYIFFVIRHYEKFSVDGFLYKIGNTGEKFYERFVSFFHYKRTLFLGITGMLVLHLLTDVGNFLLPYLFPFREGLYLAHLGKGHEALFPLFLEQAKMLSFFESLALSIIYVLNYIALLGLLLVPAYLWLVMSRNKEFELNKYVLSFFFTSVIALIITPVFGIRGILENNIVGVDIMTSPAKNIFFDSFTIALLFIIGAFFIILLLDKYIKRVMLNIGFIVGTAFFGYYTTMFFISTTKYYIGILSYLISISHYLELFFMGLFMIITILFYVIGFILFVDDVIKFKVLRRIV